MLKAAVLALAAASATSSPALVSTAPWWERITVTVDSEGKPQACQYETSLKAAKSGSCEVVAANGAQLSPTAAGVDDQYTRITFERRFIPAGGSPSATNLQPGDKLLGGQIMAIAISGEGSVETCKVVATRGEMTPNYGCDEAKTERFEASARRASAEPRHGFMTVMVYGHEENVA